MQEVKNGLARSRGEARVKILSSLYFVQELSEAKAGLANTEWYPLEELGAIYEMALERLRVMLEEDAQA
jgi:hypothetical protein